MPRTALIIIGHSHISSVVNALQPRPGEIFDSNDGCEYFIFNTVKYGSDFSFSVPDEEKGFILNPKIVEMVNAKIPSNYNKVFVSMFGGNAHNALTLIEHPKPFDFISPENINWPRRKDSILLPYNYIKRFIFKMAEVYMLNLATLRHAFSEQVIHIESPPSIGDDQFVLDNLDHYFDGQYEIKKVVPRALRHKLWRVHSSVISQNAEQMGVMFLPAASDTMDDEGFLLPHFYGTDATHAGPAYGLRIMKQLEEHMKSGYGGWSWL